MLAALALTFSLAGAALAGPHNARHAEVAAHKIESRNCKSFPAHPDPEIIEIVYRVTRARSSAYKVMHATFATALIESNLNNLPCGDRKSHGVFQQQPSPEFIWGTVEETMDPVHATNRFLDVLIPIYEKHQDWPANRLAQETQQAQAGDQYIHTLDRAESIIAGAKKDYEVKLAAKKAAALKAAKLAAEKKAAAKSKSESIAAARTRSIQASISSVAAASQSAELARQSAAEAAANPKQTGAGGAKNVAAGPGSPGEADNAGVRSAISGLTLVGALLVAVFFS